jgi:hypothetical protein
VAALAVIVAGIAVAAATAGDRTPSRRPVPEAAVTRNPAVTVGELPPSPAAAAAELARDLFTRAPAVVVASPATRAGLAAAAAMATRLHAPLLLSPASANAADRAAVRAAVRSLRPAAVLASGLPARALAALLPHVRIVSSARGLPRTVAPAALHKVALLVDQNGAATPAALSAALATTAKVAGAAVVGMTGTDPRTDPAAIVALAATRPHYVIGVGAGLGPVPELASRIAVAETGVQLAGGGEVLFPGREIVALYGTPGDPALGILGHQGLQATIARAKATAAKYRSLSRTPVVPSLEIIATVAIAGPGPSGTYSHVISVASLRPWVVAAIKAGLYVTLDLQPGRASFLAQAEQYQSLLKLPDVGLALDPEWKLQPGELPLRQIGSVRIAEVNQVASWLAGLTERYHLPQKLLELHEFRLSMISGIRRLATGNGNLAVVINMDGQGPPRAKQQTWQGVVAGAPRGVFFGWKDFYVKDRPMLGPQNTIGRSPVPVVISYQ